MNNNVVADNLKKRRAELGLTISETAEKCGILRSRYHNYETGFRKPDAATLKMLAEGLQISVGELTGGASVLFEINQRTGEPEIAVDKIPVFTLKQAARLENFNMSEAKQWLPAVGLDPGAVFAVTINKEIALDKADLSFKVGDFVAVDYNRQPQNNDIVLVKDGSNSIFGLFKTENKRRYLLLDQSNEKNDLFNTDIIIGVVCRHYPKPRDF